MAQAPEPRKEMPSPRLEDGEFEWRFRGLSLHAAFEPLAAELDRITAAARNAYAESRQSPPTRKAGPGHADPDYDLAQDWIAARGDRGGRGAEGVPGHPPACAACPRLVALGAHLPGRDLEVVAADLDRPRGRRGAGRGAEALDLSRLSSHYGRNIHPCKAWFSTATALCHWPCSCYPNCSLGQSQDWMNEIYPMWLAADEGLTEPRPK